ncbi:MAG: hypothetical protein ABSH56_22240 [Bryobacteraceae bacterium]
MTEAEGTKREIPTWHIQFSVNGRQYRESTHTESYNEAQRFLKRRITEVTSGKFQGTKIDRTPMSELLKDVLADYELKDRHSLDSMARPLIDKYLLPYFGRYRACNVKMPVIAAYLRSRKEAGRAVASINRELGLLRRAFTLGVTNGKVGQASVPDFKGLFQKEKNARANGSGNIASTKSSGMRCPWMNVALSSSVTGPGAGLARSLPWSGRKWI